MRKVLLTLLAMLALLATTATTGCTNEIVLKNARSSAAGFLTGVFSSAVNASLNGNG